MTRKVVEQKLIKLALFSLFSFINKTINMPQQYFVVRYFTMKGLIIT